MINKEDELMDNFLRNSFESKTFVNKPEYWQNAQELIAKERKNNISFKPIIVGTIVVLATITSLLVYNTHSVQSATEPNQLTVSAVPVGTTGSAPVIPVSESTSSSNYSASQDPSTQNENPTTLNNQFPSNQQTTTVASNPDKPKHRGKKSRLKPMDDANNSESAELKTQTSPTVIVINGKTYTTPLNTNNKTVQATKTNAFIAQAAKEQKSYFGIEAGINMSNPSLTVQDLNTQLGIKYFRYIGPKLALSGGLTYARVHQNLPTRAYENTNYDFGKNEAAINITTQRLDYIELPVNVLYQFIPKHSLTAGVALAYVIQSSDKVEDQINGTQSNKTGYLSAVNRWDAQLMLGYQYQFSPKIWLGSSVHFGLMDISNNAAFGQSTIHTNKGLRLTVGYRIF